MLIDPSRCECSDEVARSKWATCVMAQLGYFRLSCNRAVLPTPVSTRLAIGFLTPVTFDSKLSDLARNEARVERLRVS
jgi:hypothetical protein